MESNKIPPNEEQSTIITEIRALQREVGKYYLLINQVYSRLRTTGIVLGLCLFAIYLQLFKRIEDSLDLTLLSIKSQASEKKSLNGRIDIIEKMLADIKQASLERDK